MLQLDRLGPPIRRLLGTDIKDKPGDLPAMFVGGITHLDIGHSINELDRGIYQSPLQVSYQSVVPFIDSE